MYFLKGFQFKVLFSSFHHILSPFILFFIVISFFNILFSSVSFSSVSFGTHLSSQSIKTKILQNKKEQRKYLSKLYDTHQKIKKVQKKKAYYLKQSSLLKTKAQALAKEILDLERRQNQKKKQIQKLFQNLYRKNHYHPLKFLFSFSNFVDQDKNFKYLKKIFQKNKEQIKNYQELKKRYFLKRESLKNTLRQFLVYKNRIQEKERVLLSMKDEKHRILESLRKKETHFLTTLHQKKEDSLKSRYALSFLDQKGFLKSPIAGNPKIKYGFLKSVEDSHFFQNGTFYKISSDTVVRSIYSGRIAFAGFLDGYGNLLILDHGDQYYSVYANLSHFLVKKGDRVSELQEIAKIKKSYKQKLGQEKLGYRASGLYKESGLYFEIRHFSEPLNSKEWLD